MAGWVRHGFLTPSWVWEAFQGQNEWVSRQMRETWQVCIVQCSFFLNPNHTCNLITAPLFILGGSSFNGGTKFFSKSQRRGPEFFPVGKGGPQFFCVYKGVGCPSRTKFWSSDFCFAPKLNLGLDNLKLFFRLREKNFELFRPRVNFGRKQDDLKNFVPEGHPTKGGPEKIGDRPSQTEAPSH